MAERFGFTAEAPPPAVLRELARVFFECRGLLEGRKPRTVLGANPSSLLYPLPAGARPCSAHSNPTRTWPVPSIDTWTSHLGAGSLSVALLVALFLGLRHASDPDHLAAVSTLVLGDERERAWRAGALGLYWGIGHGTTLVALGLPLVLFGRHLPGAVHNAAEVLVGAVIVVLAVRLLTRWRAGRFDRSTRKDGPGQGGEPSRPAGAPRNQAEEGRLNHAHAGRSPISAFGIGLLHGVGGSAGAGILLVTAGGRAEQAVLALLIFAAGTAVSMALVSGGFGYALGRGPVARGLTGAVPVFGVITLLFGIWYALGALEVVPYAF
jgi:cytochrome c biogenesis protein CcdA